MESVLWNVNSEEYKNGNTRIKSLEKLAKHLNVSGSFVIIYYYFVFSLWNRSYARIQQSFIWKVWREFPHFFKRGGHQNQNKYATQLLFKRISRNYKQKCGPGTNNNVELKWEYFNALTFLHDTIKARKSHSTLVFVYANLSCHGTFPDILK